MTRDLTERELDGEIGRLFYASIESVKDMIKAGALTGCEVCCPAIDDDKMVDFAYKGCGVKADFLYYFCVNGTKKTLMRDRYILKDMLNTFLEVVKNHSFDGATVIESNLITSSKKDEDTVTHFLCYLMKGQKPGGQADA